MTYKDTLFFVGKCLTINHEEHNRIDVEKELKSGLVNWDNVVKVSTSHYVFPALYCNLKKANFLDYLPNDLVEYMQHITDLNRERNEQIIEQAKEINELLLENNITPIFLKGTGNLLSGLYNDIAERMVGDIDFLVDEHEFKNSVEILKNNGYSEFHKNKPDNTLVNRHYPKMIKKDRISSIEVHYKMVSDKRFTEFNFEFIKKALNSLNGFNFLSYEDKIIMSCINKQFNDNGYMLKNFSLRNSYDLFVLSLKASPLKAIKKTSSYLLLNPFLLSSNKVFNSPKTIDYEDNQVANSFYQSQIQGIDSVIGKKRRNFRKILVRFKYLFNLFLKTLHSKEHRKYVYKRIKSMF
jgi:hypothetical protein